MNAAARLRRAVKRLDQSSIVAHAAAFGLDARAVGRALAGRDLKAVDYLRFCRAAGIDPVTGASQPDMPPHPLRISWHLIGMSVKLAQINSGLGVREIAPRIGLSPSTITRARCGEELSTDSFLAICLFLRVAPDHFAITTEVGAPVERRAA